MATLRKSSRVASAPAPGGAVLVVWAGLAGMRRGSGNCEKRRDYGLIAILVGRRDQRGSGRAGPSQSAIRSLTIRAVILYRNLVRIRLCWSCGRLYPDGMARRRPPA